MRFKTKTTFKGRRDKVFIRRKKFCRFCVRKVKDIDYKDIKLLETFISERAKIISTRSSGNCAKHQRRLSLAIKRAKFMSLLPYVRV